METIPTSIFMVRHQFIKNLLIHFEFIYICTKQLQRLYGFTIDQLQIRCGNEIIEQVNEMKVLGVIFERHLTWKPRIAKVINPLSANVGYIRHDTVVTSDSCNSEHSENYKKILTFSCKSLKVSTKWFTKLCILIDLFLRNCVTKPNFRYFF